MQLSISKVQQNLMFQNDIITFEYTLNITNQIIMFTKGMLYHIQNSNL